MPVNNISATLSQADLDTLLNDIAEIEGKLGFLISATTRDKRSRQLMGPGSIGFVQYGLNTAKNNQSLLARNFSVEEFEKDVILVNQLQQLNGRIAPLAQKIKDTLIMLGAELMEQTNEVYNVVKREAKSDNTLRAVADEMGRRYEVSREEVAVTPVVSATSLN